MENYDTNFSSLVREGDVIVSGFNFGNDDPREQAATAILAKKIPLMVAGSFGNVASRNSINIALMTRKCPTWFEDYAKLILPTDDQEDRKRFVSRKGIGRALIRRHLPAPTTSQEKVLSHWTGWKLLWDVKRSQIEVQEGVNGRKEMGGEARRLTCELREDYCQGWSGEVG